MRTYVKAVVASTSLWALALFAADKTPMASSVDDSAVQLPAERVVASAGADSDIDAHLEALRQNAGGVDLIDARAFRQGRGFDAEDLLGATPGIYIKAENGTESAKISIRGSGLQSDGALGVELLLDGLPYNEGDGEADLEDFNLSTIRYAEVFRGANALKYGGYTLGGAINFIPFTGYDAPRAQAKAVLGSFGFRLAQLSSGGVSGSADAFAAFSEQSRQGFRQHNHEENQKAFANLGWRFNADTENRVYLSVSRVNRQMPGSLTKAQLEDDPRRFGDDDVVKEDFHLRWNAVRIADRAHWKNGASLASVGAFFNHRDFIQKDFYGSEDPTAQGIQTYRANDYGGTVNFENTDDVFGAENHFTAGLLAHQQVQPFVNYKNRRGRENGVIASARTIASNASVFAADQWFVVPQRLSLQLGFQAVYAGRDFHNRLASALPDGHSASKNYRGFNPKAGLLWTAANDTQAFANLSRSFQPPSFDQMTFAEEAASHPLVFSPLAVQTAWTLEVGTRGQRGRASWDLAMYRAWLSNELLDLNDAEGRPLGTTNARRTVHQGFELGGEIRLADAILSPSENPARRDRLVLGGSYLWNDFRFSGDPAYGDNRVAGIPLQFARLNLDYEHPCGFYAGIDLEWNLARYPVDQANTLRAGEYALIGAQIGFRTRHGFSVFVQGKNLGDARYAATAEPIADARVADDNAIFRPGDGRAFYTGVAFAF